MFHNILPREVYSGINNTGTFILVHYLNKQATILLTVHNYGITQN